MKVLSIIVLILLLIDTPWLVVSFLRDKKAGVKVNWARFLLRLIINLLVLYFCFAQLFPNVLPL